MNISDLDFINISEYLNEKLGITNPTDIDALKTQLEETLNELEKPIRTVLSDKIAFNTSQMDELTKELNELTDDFEKLELQKQIDSLQSKMSKDFSGMEHVKIRHKKEMDAINDETDVNKLLKKCIFLKCLVVTSITAKYKIDDTEEERQRKRKMQLEANSIYDMARKTPSFVDLIKQRTNDASNNKQPDDDDRR